jgi:hypothetical protein
MEEIAPIISLEIPVVCPECKNEQEVSFDIQSFFMNRLAGERNLFFSEINNIAKTYHWSMPQILDLPRSVRKNLVMTIDREN